MLSFNCVLAVNQIVITFNFGFSPSNTSFCNDLELAQIDAALGISRRFLRSSDTNSLTMSETSLPSSKDERDLTFLKNCNDKCENYAPGCCRALGCKGFRALSADVNEKSDRSLLTCTSEVNEIHAKLDNIHGKSTTSLTCKNFLDKSKRRTECYTDNEYGQTEGVRIWNITKNAQIVLHPFIAPNATVTLCKSMSMNLEALNEPCVTKAKFVLRRGGTLVRESHEVTPPHSLFGDTGLIFNAANLAVGMYKLYVSPDYESKKRKEFNINVLNC